MIICNDNMQLGSCIELRIQLSYGTDAVKGQCDVAINDGVMDNGG